MISDTSSPPVLLSHVARRLGLPEPLYRSHSHAKMPLSPVAVRYFPICHQRRNKLIEIYGKASKTGALRSKKRLPSIQNVYQTPEVNMFPRRGTS